MNFLVTVNNAHTKQTEVYQCFSITFGENALGFPMQGAKQVHLYAGTFGRKDSCICIETFDTVKVEPFPESINDRPDGY